MRKYSTKAFTLIELMIVLGIILILAAIAIPNFHNASVRAKVSRAHADMRSMASAIESYAVDHSRYPRMSWSLAPYNDSFIWEIGPWITTPVAYITSIPEDVFVKRWEPDATSSSFGYHLPTYINTRNYSLIVEQGDQPVGYELDAVEVERMQKNIGEWAYISPGPDRFDYTVAERECWIPYDPTNGTVSAGQIIRAQLSPLVTEPLDIIR